MTCAVGLCCVVVGIIYTVRIIYGRRESRGDLGRIAPAAAAVTSVAAVVVTLKQNVINLALRALFV